MAFVKPPARNMPPGSEPWAQWVEEQMSSVTKQTVAVSQYAERAAGGVNSALEGNIQNRDEINRVFEVTEKSMQLADGAVVWSTLDPELPEDVPINPNVIWYTYDPETREVLRMWQWGYYDDVEGVYVEDWYQAQLGADSIHDEAITSAKVALGAIDWDQIGPGVTATVEGAVSGISDLQETVTSVGGMVTTSGSAPTTEQGTGKPTGAVWYQYSSSNQLNGSWRWSGTAWISMPIGDNAVAELNAAKLTAGVLNAARIASNSIVGDKIVANAITARELAVGAITADKAIIANAAIKSAMIAEANILTAHIDNLAVTNAKIANTTITDAKILNLDAGKITTGFLDAARIQANSIVTSKLAATAIDGMTITGSVLQTSSSANTGIKIDTANGLRAWAGGNLGVQISPSIKNGMAVRNPVGEMVPLSDAAFGTVSIARSNSLFVAAPQTSGAWSAWTRHSDTADDCVLTFTAVSTSYIVSWSQSWATSYNSAGDKQTGVQVGLSTGGSGNLISSGNGGQITGLVGYLQERSADVGDRVRSVTMQGPLSTVVGQTYTLRMYFRYNANGPGTHNISVAARTITATPVY